MEIEPDARLMTKQWLTLLSISFFIGLIGVVLQVLVPLKPDQTAGQVARVLWPIVAVAIALTWGISAPLVRLWIKNLSYFVEEDRITIHKGILTKVRQNIPFRAVTDFRLHRSLFDRWLGIGTIQIQTAGQSQSATGFEGHLSGLAQFEELLTILRKKLEALHPVSQARTLTEPASLSEDSTDQVLQLILEELRSIRKALETR